MIKTCPRCNRDMPIRARRLCAACYKYAERTSTLADWPKLGPGRGSPPQERPRGPSYRQLDYWASRGYLNPENEGKGTGVWRVWPEEEVRVAELMARLVAAGLPPSLAHRIARAGGKAEIAPGVEVFVHA